MGSRKATTISAGTITVPTANQRDRTRSMYSRGIPTHSLSTGGDLRLGPRAADAGGARSANALQEDLGERGVHELEPLDRRAGVDQSPEQALRVGARRELDLESAVRVVDAAHERAVGEDPRGAVAPGAIL